MATRCMPPALTSQHLVSAAAQYAAVRVLHIGDAPLAWGGWSDPNVGCFLHTRSHTAISPWCNSLSALQQTRRRPWLALLLCTMWSRCSRLPRSRHH